jgi:hypothetical protein
MSLNVLGMIWKIVSKQNEASVGKQKMQQQKCMATLTILSFFIGLGRMPAIPALALRIGFGGFILAPPLTAPMPLTPSRTLPTSSLSLFFPRFSCSTGCENAPCTALVGVAVPALRKGVPTLPGTCTGGMAGFVWLGRGRAESGIETGTELCLGSVDDDPGLETADPGPDIGPGTADPGLCVPMLPPVRWKKDVVADVGIGA